MRYLSLFSGIEAASAAWHPLGWACAAFAEIDPFPCAVLKHHYPGIPNLGDVTKITKSQIEALGHIDLVVFGSPCQDLSIAGKREGLKGKRSGLFFDAMRIVRWARARYALFENVPGLLSSNEGRDFAAVVGEMVGVEPDVPVDGWQNSGAFLGPDGLVEMAILDAQFFGVPQRRRRVFALRDIGNWADRPPILLERESVQRHPPPRRETGQGSTYATAPSLTGSGRGVEWAGESRGQDPVVAMCLNAKGGSGRSDFESETLIAHTLRAEGFDAGEDRTGRGIPLVAYALGSHSGAADGDQTNKSHASGGPVGLGISEELAYSVRAARTQAVAFNLRGREDGAQVELTDMASLRAASGGSSRSYVAIGLDEEQNATIDSFGCLKARTEGGGFEGSVMTNSAVRRLLSEECEKLQGFKPGYTLVPYRGKPAADGPRYKALGNSMAVPCMAWIGSRIQAVEQLKAESEAA